MVISIWQTENYKRIEYVEKGKIKYSITIRVYYLLIWVSVDTSKSLFSLDGSFGEDVILVLESEGAKD